MRPGQSLYLGLLGSALLLQASLILPLGFEPCVLGSALLLQASLIRRFGLELFLHLGLLGSALLLQAGLLRRFGLEPFVEILTLLRELLDQIVGACRLGFEFAGAILKPGNLFLGRRRPAHELRDAAVYISQLFLKAICLRGRLLLRTFERLASLLKFCQSLFMSFGADTSGHQRSTYEYCHD